MNGNKNHDEKIEQLLINSGWADKRATLLLTEIGAEPNAIVLCRRNDQVYITNNYLGVIDIVAALGGHDLVADFEIYIGR